MFKIRSGKIDSNPLKLRQNRYLIEIGLTNKDPNVSPIFMYKTSIENYKNQRTLSNREVLMLKGDFHLIRVSVCLID
jgi:hypothetical protein